MILRNFVRQTWVTESAVLRARVLRKREDKVGVRGEGPHSFWIGPCPHVLAWASPWVKCGLEDTTSCP